MKTLFFISGLMVACLCAGQANAEEADSAKTVKTIEKTITITDDGKSIHRVVVDGKDLSEQEWEHFPGPDHRPGARRQKVVMIETDDRGRDSILVWMPDCPPFYGKEGDSLDFIHQSHRSKLPKEILMRKPFPDFDQIDPDFPHFRQFQKEIRRMHEQPDRMIDLNDPEIISFQRETTKDGHEKITIIRKTPGKKQ